MQNGFALFVVKQYIVLKLQADLPQEDVGERKMAVRILGYGISLIEIKG